MLRVLSRILIAGSLLVAACGCGVRVGTDVEPPQFAIKDAGSAYCKVRQIPKYDGTVVAAHVFRSGQHTGEIASLWTWPLGGLDLGLLGIRLKLLGLETGAGTLFFQPEPLPDEYYGVDDEVD
jgi:hypothetical protein